MLPLFTEDVENITNLSDYPNEEDGLTSAQLKALFDKAGVDIKEYLNSLLIPELTSAINEAAAGRPISEAGIPGSNIIDGTITARKLSSVSGSEAVTTQVIHDGAVTLIKLDGNLQAKFAALDNVTDSINALAASINTLVDIVTNHTTQISAMNTTFSEAIASLDERVTALEGGSPLPPPTPVTTYNYSVTFNANGGSNPPAKQEETSEETSYEFTLSSVKPTRNLYNFAGWYLNSSGTGTKYNAGGKITVTSADPNITLYAKWIYNVSPTPQEQTYTVRFNGNGADGTSVYTQTITRNVSTTLRANTFSRSGYEFIKWNTKPDGTGTSYSDREAVTNIASAGGSIDLYAQWFEIVYIVTKVQYDLDGGSGTFPTQSHMVEIGSSYTFTIPSTEPTLTDMVFADWYDEFNDMSYSPGGTIEVLAGQTITLTARWTEPLET